MSNWVGKRLGKVQVESLVGRGGVAEVYLGTHTTLERKVAVKILRNLNDENPDALIRFQREARVIAKLRHPNIVQVHDFDTVENDPYLVMEYIEGPSLSRYLHALHREDRQIPLHQVVRLLDGIASALQYAHNNGVIHRDIKPGNILLTSPTTPVVVGSPLPEDFEPILTDFGLVRFLDANRETTTGHIAGTPAYMSPEQARGEATDGRTDVYSLGIVLYEVLAGHVPFDGETTVSILLKQVNQSPPPITQLSPFLEEVLNRALAKDVKARYQTPMDFANAFRAAMETGSDHSTLMLNDLQLEAAPPKPESPEPAAKQLHWVRFALPALLLAALAGFIFLYRSPSSQPEGITPALPIVPSPSNTSILPTATPTSTQPAPVAQGPSGILRFQNNAAIADQVSLIVRTMPAPPPGSHYEVWLTGGDDRLSLGTFSPDETGQGKLVFSAPEGLNLLSIYDRVEITIEPDPDTDPEPSDLIAYSFTLPSEGLTHIRYLLSAFPGTPDKQALIQGLYTDIERINELAQEMQDAFKGGDQASVQEKAEEALNLLVGPKSPDYKDWNGDGKILDKSATYGLLVNGSNFGYIQAVYAEADYIVNTPGATQYMVENGEIVKTCNQNLTLWAPQLRQLLLTILTSPSDVEVSQSIADVVTLTDRMLNGVDLDQNGKVNTVSGECGAQAIYQYAYYMADMPVLPVSISYQLTVVANPAYVAPTRVRDNSQNGGGSQNNPPVNTPRPKPTKKDPNPNKPDKKKQ